MPPSTATSKRRLANPHEHNAARPPLPDRFTRATRDCQPGTGIRPYRCRIRQPIPKIAGRICAFRHRAPVPSSLHHCMERGIVVPKNRSEMQRPVKFNPIRWQPNHRTKTDVAGRKMLGPGRLSENLAPETNATAEAAFITLRKPSRVEEWIHQLADRTCLA